MLIGWKRFIGDLWFGSIWLSRSPEIYENLLKNYYDVIADQRDLITKCIFYDYVDAFFSHVFHFWWFVILAAVSTFVEWSNRSSRILMGSSFVHSFIYLHSTCRSQCFSFLHPKLHYASPYWWLRSLFFFFLPILIHVIKLNSKRMIRMNSVQYLTVKMIIVYAVPLDMNSISWKCNRQTSSTYRHRFTWKQSQSGKLVRTKDSNNIQNHSLKTIPLFLRVYLFVNW